MPERKVIIYTDPVDKDFNAPDGKVYFKHRWVQSKDGSITEHAWVFKEKAIETVFNRLVINGSQVQSDAEDEDDIIEAMQASGLDCQKDSGAEETKVGQIVVKIRRVRLGPKKYDPNYRPIHEEGHDDDIDMDGVKPDITHATGFSFTKTVLRSPLRVVEYYDYKPGEDLWATFQFFYRSAGMGLADPSISVVQRITYARLNLRTLRVSTDVTLQISSEAMASEVLNLDPE